MIYKIVIARQVSARGRYERLGRLFTKAFRYLKISS